MAGRSHWGTPWGPPVRSSRCGWQRTLSGGISSSASSPCASVAARLWPHYCVASESPGHDDQGIDSLVASLLHRGLSPALLWFWGYVLDSTTLDRYVAAFSHRDTCIVFDYAARGSPARRSADSQQPAMGSRRRCHPWDAGPRWPVAMAGRGEGSDDFRGWADGCCHLSSGGTRVVTRGLLSA